MTHPTPTPLEIPIKCHMFLKNMFCLTEPPLLWGEHECLLELHNLVAEYSLDKDYATCAAWEALHFIFTYFIFGRVI